MIICNSHNFTVIRAPKTGGTSLELYIIDSGLLDSTTDVYALEGGFTTIEEFKAYSDTHGELAFPQIDKEFRGVAYLADAQKPFSKLVEEGKVASAMPCIGGIRHPLERLASLYYYANLRNEILNNKHLAEHGTPFPMYSGNKSEFGEPDASWDLIFRKVGGALDYYVTPQMDYYPDHAQLFNVENMNEHVSQFISDKGGNVPAQTLALRASGNDPSYYLNNLSEDRKRRSLEIYEKDLIAWEKAYAVYN
tara:strand:- start:715 stop:1464 length:750 start_codon:yes stop_codon:yes gene_type:complete